MESAKGLNSEAYYIYFALISVRKAWNHFCLCFILLPYISAKCSVPGMLWYLEKSGRVNSCAIQATKTSLPAHEGVWKTNYITLTNQTVRCWFGSAGHSIFLFSPLNAIKCWWGKQAVAPVSLSLQVLNSIVLFYKLVATKIRAQFSILFNL